MIEFRRVRPDDIDLLLQSAKELNFDKTIMLEKLDSMMVVMNGDRLCGIGCGINIEDKCLLNWIYISKENRREQLGTALVKTLLNNAELSGATFAYLSGSCKEFADFLKFEEVQAINEKKDLKELYRNIYGISFEENFYKAELAGYFKPCCSK
jgi:N-acetylglutamate synthase-like GNAT family acetyltransferase